MKQYYYYKSLRKNIIQFLDLFNDIEVARYDNTGNIIGTFEVPLKLAPKSKAWYWIYEKKSDIMLPIISAQITSIDYAETRQTNRLRSIIKSRSLDEGQIQKYLNPVPYDLGFQLTIWAKHMIDIDQVLEQTLPYFGPFVNMRITMDQLDTTFDIKVLLNNATPDLNSEYGDEERRLILWNLDFTSQTYLFKPLSDVGLIEKIITKYYNNEETWENNRFTETIFTSGGGAESVATLHKRLGYDEDANILYSYERWGD